MKKLALLLILSITISCSQAQKTDFTAETLDTKLLGLDGTDFAFKDIIAQHKGKTILMEVWASWCSDCVKAMPKVKELQKSNPEIVYLFISMDKTTEKWNAGIDKYGLNGYHFMAPDGMKGIFGKSIDLDWIPRYMVIDKSGKIALYRAVETDFDKIDQTLKSQK